MSAAALDLLVDALAAYRLTRLVTADTITEPLRARIVIDAFVKAGLDVPAGENAEGIVEVSQALGLPAQLVPKLATLVTCRWCAGVWVAAGVVVAATVAPRPWRWVARALAVSAAAALIARAED